MMSNIAVHVEGLGKRYRIGGATAPYRTVREAIVSVASAPFRNLQRIRSLGSLNAVESENTVWALQGVGFEVKHGEVLGVVGRNGAGKSTLLKILSRITKPTTGRALVDGRVGSLLEVGTGFHPELTGRDNIYLNGSILGMDRAYIAKRFSEIVEFAGVEKFIDTPVKRYSSGMYLRLAFAVAAHLEPEVLVVDEVLAVGDADFQKKCIGKMGEVAREGRTVLFVSHNMAAIRHLCDTAILLDHGGVAAQGAVTAVVQQYLSVASAASRIPLGVRSDRQGNGDIRFQAVALRNKANESVASLTTGDTAKLVVYFENRVAMDLRNLQLSVGIDNSAGQRIAVLSSELAGEPFTTVSSDTTCIEIQIEKLPLAPGRYGYTLFSSHNGVIADWIQDAGSFNVEAGDFFGTGRLPSSAQGDFLVDCRFGVGSDHV
jgi:lipopolysaccharide transport system ATP-binding protein